MCTYIITCDTTVGYYAVTSSILLIDIPNSRGLVLGETRSPYLLTNVLRLFIILNACCVWYVHIHGLRGQSKEAILFIDIPNSRGLVLGETRSLYLLANALWLFSTKSACCVWYVRGVLIQGLRGQSEEAILFIDTANSRGLVLGETRSPYLLANVLREQLTFRIGLWPLHGPSNDEAIPQVYYENRGQSLKVCTFSFSFLFYPRSFCIMPVFFQIWFYLPMTNYHVVLTAPVWYAVSAFLQRKHWTDSTSVW